MSIATKRVGGGQTCLAGLSETSEPIDPGTLAYMNRLSDLIWFFGRKIELAAGVIIGLRAMHAKQGQSRAW